MNLTGEANGALLDAAEQERAARFRFSRDRERFIACRAALRTILGTQLDCDPARIVFRIGEHGRPYLTDAGEVEFNVSHSGDLALIAIGAQAPLGVDVEVLREVNRAIDLARRYLHPDEIHLIETATPAQRSALFLSCWARKEAVLKSTGVGLTLDTRKVNVSAASEEKVLELPHFPPLRVISLTPAEGYIAACAASPNVRHFKFRRFEP